MMSLATNTPLVITANYLYTFLKIGVLAVRARGEKGRKNIGIKLTLKLTS
jgi:hypothetical protein